MSPCAKSRQAGGESPRGAHDVCAGVTLSHALRAFGPEEAALRELLADLLEHGANPTLSLCTENGEALLLLSAGGDTAEECEERMAPLLWDLRARLGEYLYGVDVDSLAQRAVQLLKARRLTLSAAESCTGGLVAKLITDVPGASAIFLGGVVSYTNAVKSAVLGVPQALLDEHGAVSAPVARAMAECVRRLTGSDLALSVTGVAGPDRDDRGNAVGTVFIGLAGPESAVVRRLSLKGGREQVRNLAARHALDILRRYLTGLPIE